MQETRTNNAEEPYFVSRQVAESRRFYLDLNPSKSRPLVVVCGGVERMQSDYLVARTDFPYYAIEIVTEGKGKLTLDGKESPLSSGMLFAYGPKLTHRIENLGEDRMRKYYVDFAGRDARRALRNLGLLSGQPLRVTALHEIVEVFEALHREGCHRHNTVAGHLRNIASSVVLKDRTASRSCGNKFASGVRDV